ncbi:uncharacterized protein LOC126470039 [Schistocerca serialis cubense]|uniref:uncharacterized protein LOC126470039 n=1 Tax=Schistocerca serialis cubense TaxID=2023355 RepID=UPI00214E75B9|nr:uncharacterized protein LOC126470039 [Schistocerca serialis cubense]
MVKACLDRCNRKEARFKNNFPGIDWARQFMQGHNAVLTLGLTKNIMYARAENDKEIMNAFFDNLEIEMEDVPSVNLWNYDEINLVDEPRGSKIITKRGTKYPEQIQNLSKTCNSLIVCGNAVGTLAPLILNYKAEKLWDT